MLIRSLLSALKMSSLPKTITLLHFYSHTSKRYKDSLLETMIHRAYDLSSTTKAFNAECVKLRSIFSRLDYPMGLINSAIINSSYRNASAGIAEKNTDKSSTVRISLPFKDQVAVDAVRKQLRDFSRKILPILQPIFVSKKLGQDLKPNEIKPSIVNR